MNPSTHPNALSKAQAMADHFEIRQIIDDWVLLRDAGEWDRFAGIWHPEGWMVTTWYRATAADFIARSRAAWDAGLKVHHFLGGTNINIHGDRAVAQTKMQILQRADVHDVLVDVCCQGRFWDAFEKIDGAWKLVLRQPIYEIDRMSVIDPASSLALDPDLLARFPEGYRHLAYLQTQLGLEINLALPGTKGPEVDALKDREREWLAGAESYGFVRAAA